MPDAPNGSLLSFYYETFLKDQDIEKFRISAMTRYNEGSLCRLVESTSLQSRRAAILALGLLGSFECNAAVAHALRDEDLTVRRMASDALWAIWFRADSDENNKTLEQVARLIARQQADEAIVLATRLIERAPKFAEAYNQRAIAHWSLGQLEESVADCRKVLELNPFHTGALAGMAQCLVKLGQHEEALRTLQRALKIEPFNMGLRSQVTSLEANGD